MRTTHWLIYSQFHTESCSERGANLNARDSWGYTPLQRAATNDCVDAAKALLAAGASLEDRPRAHDGGDNALREKLREAPRPVLRLHLRFRRPHRGGERVPKIPPVYLIFCLCPPYPPPHNRARAGTRCASVARSKQPRARGTFTAPPRAPGVPPTARASSGR